MTALTVRPSLVDDGSPKQGSWDPLLRPIALLLLVVALIYNSAALDNLPNLVIPNTVPLLLGLACVGFAFIVPRREKVVVPMAAISLVILAYVSLLWSRDEASSDLWARSRGVVTLGIVALVLVLPTSDLIKAIKAYVWIVLLITIFAVATDPFARVHIDPTGANPPLKGWHGYFLHKNIMAAFLIFALATVIQFDKNRWTRWPSLAAIVFLFVVSDSTTGRMAALVLLAVQLWSTLNSRLDRRSSAALAVSTAALVAVAGIAIGLSLSTIADAAGKDLTFTGRTKIWTATWHAFLRDPILGHGVVGLYGVPYTPETAALMREIGFLAGHPHSGVLDVAAQFGIVGIVLVGVIVVSIFRTSVKLQRRSPEIGTWGLCIISAIVIMSVGESVFLGSAIPILILVRTVVLRESKAKPRGLETAASGNPRVSAR